MPDVLEKDVTETLTNQTVTTTTETSLVSSPLVKVPLATCRVIIKAFCHMQTGAGTTDVTTRIRRGDTTGGALVGEAVNEIVKAAAGSTEFFFTMTTEVRSNVESVQYNLTIEQTGATGNGTAQNAIIEVEVLNG